MPLLFKTGKEKQGGTILGILNYILQTKEGLSMPKSKPQTKASIIIWRTIMIITLSLVILDLYLYQGIYSIVAETGLLTLYIRYTFPKIRDKKRIITWSIISIIVLFLLLVDDFSIVFMIFIAPFYLWASFSREYETVYYPLEIRFYDDHLVLYREKHPHLGKILRKQYDKIYYKDVVKCELGKYPKGAIKIYGKVEVIRHKYDKNGVLVEKPIFNKTVDAFCYIYTKDTPEVDFVAEIEKHSPIRIKNRE